MNKYIVAAADYLEANPDKWRQRTWFGRTLPLSGQDLRSGGCCAGGAVIGAIFADPPEGYEVYTYDTGYRVLRRTTGRYVREIDPGSETIHAFAPELLAVVDPEGGVISVNDSAETVDEVIAYLRRTAGE